MRKAGSLEIIAVLTFPERNTGFEPVTPTWKDGMLPLHQFRVETIINLFGLIVKCR